MKAAIHESLEAKFNTGKPVNACGVSASYTPCKLRLIIMGEAGTATPSSLSLSAAEAAVLAVVALSFEGSFT